MVDATPRQEPLEVAPETFLIRAVQHSLGSELSTNHNSLVIRGAPGASPATTARGSTRCICWPGA